jgi:hypothetical protein
MSDHIRIGLQAHDFDELGDARIKVRLPRGEVITILVPGFGPDSWADWITPDGQEFGLNLVTEGHYA